MATLGTGQPMLMSMKSAPETLAGDGGPPRMQTGSLPEDLGGGGMLAIPQLEQGDGLLLITQGLGADHLYRSGAAPSPADGAEGHISDPSHRAQGQGRFDGDASMDSIWARTAGAGPEQAAVSRAASSVFLSWSQIYLLYHTPTRLTRPPCPLYNERVTCGSRGTGRNKMGI